MDDHQPWLSRAFDIAAETNANTSPNPRVGCVIVRDGEIVGEGVTEPPPGRHAEIVALSQAGERARGATVYVTLEPCNHTGRTGPCTAALIDAKVSRVVAALCDPSSTAGGGAEQLRAAGIDVVTDVAVQHGHRAHEIFLHQLVHTRPFVVVKTATSVDGFVADANGHSKWITGPEARAAGHLIRAQVDAVVVGSGTVLADDPSLTVRTPGFEGSQPLRVVVDRRRRVDTAKYSMFNDAAGPVLVSHAESVHELCEELHSKGVTSMLVEGGPTLIGAFVTAGIVDRYELHFAGKILGTGRSSIGAVFPLKNAPELEFVETIQCGPDLVITAYPNPRHTEPTVTLA